MEKYARATIATDATGLGVLSVKIPGTFGGLNRGVPAWSGRVIISWDLWLAASTPGDAITSITVEDTDGLVPVPARAAFPLYPVIAQRCDSALSADQQGIYLPSIPLPLTPPPGAGALPSGLYIIVKVQKAAAVVDTIYANMKWDDLT